MEKKPASFNMSKLAQVIDSITRSELGLPVRTRTQQPKTDRKFFYDVLLQFRRAGHDVTWSNNHSYIELRFHDVPYIYHGFRKAAEALLGRIEEWKP